MRHEDLEEQISENILSCINCLRQYIVRFSDELLISIYIFYTLDDITNLKFDYKYLFSGEEKYAMLKFDYIDGQFIFKYIYFESQLKTNSMEMFGKNAYEYRFDVDLKLDSKYLHNREYKGEEPFYIKLEEYDDKGNTIQFNNHYFLAKIRKQFKNLSKILIEKKIVSSFSFGYFNYFTRSDKNDIYLIIK